MRNYRMRNIFRYMMPEAEATMPQLFCLFIRENKNFSMPREETPKQSQKSVAKLRKNSCDVSDTYSFMETNLIIDMKKSYYK